MIANEPQTVQFILKNKSLFWYIKPDRLEVISLSVLIETVLNYGDLKTVKQLFEILGIKEVSKIFFQSVEKKRNNYFPDVANYFTLYFRKYA